MLKKLSNFFGNLENESSNNLVINFDSFSLAKNTVFFKEDVFRFLDFKDELLDMKNLNKKSFSVFWRISKNSDQLLFESLNFKCNLFVLDHKFFGREYNKTTSFSVDYNGVSKSALFEVLHGEGFFILESLDEIREIKVVAVSKGSYVYIPSGQVFTMINSSKSSNMVCISLLGKNTRFKTNVLAKFCGSGVFYTKLGFIRNQNIGPNYTLKDYFGDYLEDLSFDKEVGIYQEFLNIPEKFNFLK
ncbi:MAG: hypothetical protein PF569_09750 [Candidatus Woesearchaeota archaeon]|jgi:mannose-6-phosphate isomerase-like protein (cupin superfamily)|nr:hypothetical protein [Candidatus Woesearchaeota archaeon]